MIYSFNLYTRGYHAYMNLWIPLTEDKSSICWKEKGNEYDPYGVAITRNNIVVGCVPQKYMWSFLEIVISAYDINWRSGLR